MKKLCSSLIISSMTLPILSTPVKADENYFLRHIDSLNTYEIFKTSVSGNTNSKSVVTTFDRSLNNNVFFDYRWAWMDNSLQKIFFDERYNSLPTGRVWTYSISDDSWSAETLTTNPYVTDDRIEAIHNNSHTSVTANTSNISTNTSNISTNTSNISTNTSNISTNTSNINSLGEGVAGSTALTAALTALPQTSKDSKLSCGVGTGAYSSRYALGFGCASKINERVDINAGGSYVLGGSRSYGGGTLDNGVIKAGFVFKLGVLNKTTQISFNDRNIIDKKISSLEKDNKNLKEEVEVSKAKNDEIISQNQKLLARLEKLENIALKIQTSYEMLPVATKD